MIRSIGFAIAVMALSSAGCKERPAASQVPEASTAPIAFEEVAEASGIRFSHHTGAAGKRLMPETMGSGCALVDLDNDNRLDAVMVDSTAWPGSGGKKGQTRIFRNLGEGRFEDATRAFRVPAGSYGMGVAAGDYDNDGFVDLFFSALEVGESRSRLLRNVGGKHFEDVSARVDLDVPGWASSAAWVDYNRDGRLDLFVCRYVKWTPETDVFFALDGVNKTYARPDQYPGSTCLLFKNVGGRFEDVSASAGVATSNAKALGVALCDFDGDGWVDIAVSNDTVRNFLFHNQGNGTFKEVAVQAGVAVAEAGVARAGMGIDVADYENSGQPAVLITNFAGEQVSLYRRDTSGLFMDVAARTGLGAATQRYLGFGVGFLDADLDGRLDIFVANGHIQPDVEVRSSGVTYKQPSLLMRGTADGTFREAGSGAITTPRVARGAAFGDIDGDGDFDVLMNVNDGPAVLLRQSGRPQHRWVRLRLEGRSGNRSAIGATVRLTTNGVTQTRMVRSGSSYLSQSSLAVTFGLGKAEAVGNLEVRWPNGHVETFPPPPLDRETRLIEGTGG